MSRRRKILLGLLLLVVLAPTSTLYWVATTESGLRFLVERARSVGPVRVTADEVTGTLTRGVQIGALRVQHRLSDTRIEQVQGSIRLLPLLLRRHIDISHLAAGQVSVTLLEDPVAGPGGEPRFLPPMLRIDASQVQVQELLLTLKSGRELQFSQISGAVTLLHKQIRVREASLDWENWHLTGATRVRAARPHGLDGQIDATWRPGNQPEWRMSASFDGDLDALPYRLAVSQPFLADVTGDAVLRGGWLFEGHALARDFDLTDFGGGDALGILSGELDVAVDAAGIRARGMVTAPGLDAGAIDVDFNGLYRQQRLTIRDTRMLHPPSGSRASVQGTVQIEPGGPRLALAGTWTGLQWPLAASEPAFTSPRGRYTLDGVKPWQVSAQGEILAADLPVIPARATGRLDGESFRIEQGSMELFDGEAHLTGEARWNPAQSWQVQGHMAGMDAAQLRSDLPGLLDFDFQAHGAPFGEQGTISLAITGLTGELRGQATQGSGVVSRADAHSDWRLAGVDLTIGNTHLLLDGGLGDTPDLAFTVDADDLSLIDPTARGAISARGRFTTSRDRPLLRFEGSASDLDWRGYQLGSLVADVDLDLSSVPGRATGTLLLQDLTIGARTIQNASLRLSGSGDDQQLALTVDAAPLRARMEGRGAPRNGLWQGEVTSFTIEQNDRLALGNEDAAPLSIGLREIDLGELCLLGSEARLCGEGRRDADGGWDVSFTTDTLPLSSLTAGLSQEFQYEGTIDLRGELNGRAGVLPTGLVSGHLVDARLRHHVGSGREQVMSLGTGTIDANASAETFALRVGLEAGEAGSIQGRIDGERRGAHWADFPISGALDARTDSLSLIDIYVVEIDKATGRLATRVEIGGTLGEPTLNGTLQLRDTSLDLYQINLSLRELALDASFDTTALQLAGSSRMGEGTAHFNGNLSWRDREPFGNLHVEGQRLQLVNVPEARILASPRLDFAIAGRRIDVTGEVLLPHARIEPADLTTAVLASGDEVLVGAAVVDPALRWNVHSNIRLELGDDVRLESLGLSARLGGALEVRTDPDQSSRGVGELLVSDGRYQALGRLLDIERGRLIFNNVPLNDPGIDLRAEKVFPDAIAGVNVRGSLRAPRLTFYSEPSLPQSQIASLILAGGSIESLSDSQAPGAARNDLLAQGGAILAQRVGTQVGVDDVGIESDIHDQASLVLGKYLSDRLYISYGISLAEAINTLKLRWTISDRWTIKTEAGQERSADIVYTLRK